MNVPTEVPCEKIEPASEVKELNTLSTRLGVSTLVVHQQIAMLTLSLFVLDNSRVRKQREGGEEVEDGSNGLGEHGDGQRFGGVRGEEE